MLEAEHAAVSAEVFLVIGTSAVVHPAAGLVPLAAGAAPKYRDQSRADALFRQRRLQPARPGR